MYYLINCKIMYKLYFKLKFLFRITIICEFALYFKRTTDIFDYKNRLTKIHRNAKTTLMKKYHAPEI